MQRLPSPGLTPTSQEQGAARGNEAAMAPGASPSEIPVSTQAQPSESTPAGGGMWKPTPANQ
jgi:hypothetical protein